MKKHYEKAIVSKFQLNLKNTNQGIGNLLLMKLLSTHYILSLVLEVMNQAKNTVVGMASLLSLNAILLSLVLEVVNQARNTVVGMASLLSLNAILLTPFT